MKFFAIFFAIFAVFIVVGLAKEIKVEEPEQREVNPEQGVTLMPCSQFKDASLPKGTRIGVPCNPDA